MESGKSGKVLRVSSTKEKWEAKPRQREKRERKRWPVLIVSRTWALRMTGIQAGFQVVSGEEEWITGSVTKIGNTRKGTSLGRKWSILGSVSVILDIGDYDSCK